MSRIEPAGGRRIETVPGHFEALVAQWKRISFINKRKPTTSSHFLDSVSFCSSHFALYQNHLVHLQILCSPFFSLPLVGSSSKSKSDTTRTVTARCHVLFLFHAVSVFSVGLLYQGIQCLLHLAMKHQVEMLKWYADELQTHFTKHIPGNRINVDCSFSKTRYAISYKSEETTNPIDDSLNPSKCCVHHSPAGIIPYPRPFLWVEKTKGQVDQPPGSPSMRK